MRRLAILWTVPLVVGSAIRLNLAHGRPLDQLAATLRNVPLLPRPLRRPAHLMAGLEALLRWLPPRGMRSCLKRSLLQLDLLSRCGQRPRLHVGARSGAPGDGHAWVTVDGDPLATAAGAETMAEILVT